MKLQIKNTLLFRLILVVGVFNFNAYAHEAAHKKEEVSKTPELGYDMELNVQLDKVPQLNQRTSLNIDINSLFHDVENLKVEVLLQEGLVSLQSKQFEEFELLQPLVGHQIQYAFTANQVGQYKVTVKVTGLLRGENPTDRYAYVYFTVSNDSSKSQMGWDTSYQFENKIEWSESEQQSLKIDTDGYITYSMADENLNHIETKILAEDYYSQVNKGVGTVAVSGRYRFANRENTSLVGFNSNLMQIINATNYAHLAWTYSDSNGYYTFPAVSNPGSGGFRIRVYSARFLTANQGYGVCTYGACDDNAATLSTNYDQFYMIESSVVSAANGNQNIGTFTVSWSLNTNLRAFWIKNDMDVANAHLILNSNVRGPFTAEWSGTTTHGDHYHRGANIHLRSDVGNGTNHAIMHEIGHNVMYNAGTFPAGTDCPSPHYASLVSGIQCAWTEGWANIFSELVNDSPQSCFPPSTVNCIDFEHDSSYDNCLSWDCGANADQVEGHVAGAVWDLYDNNDDDFDLDTFGRNEIYALMEANTYTSFASWWSAWLGSGYSDMAYNALFQNAIVYGTYDVRVNPFYVDDPTPAVGQAITVHVSVRNIGDVSSIGTSFRFYLSGNSTISNTDQLMGTTNHGVLDKDVTTIIENTFSVASLGQYWVGACFVDAYAYDGNSSNNCSAGYQINVSASDVIFASGFE